MKKRLGWIRTYVLQIIPAITILFYIIGFAYYIPYYSSFGINYISYISLNEMIVTIMIPVGFCLFGFCCYYLLFFSNIIVSRKNTLQKKDIERLPSKIIRKNVLSFYTKLKAIKKEQSKMDEIIIRTQSIRKTLTYQFVYIIACWSPIIICYIIYRKNVVSNLILFGAGCICQIVCILNTLHILYKIRFSVVRRLAFAQSIVMSILFFLSFIIYLGFSEAFYDKRKNSKYEFEIHTTDNKTYSSQTIGLQYIGDCASAIFLYDAEVENTIVINRSQIVSIITPQNEDIAKKLISLFDNKYDATNE